MNKLRRYAERVDLIYRFSREHLIGEYIKVLLVTFVSIVYWGYMAVFADVGCH